MTDAGCVGQRNSRHGLGSAKGGKWTLGPLAYSKVWGATMGMRRATYVAARSLTVFALWGCSVIKPPQSSFYCLEVPSGSEVDVERLMQSTGDRLLARVSGQTSEFSPGDVHRSFEIYGRGVSLFIHTSLQSGRPDEFGNRATSSNPHSYSVQAVKTGWRQGISFDEALGAVASAARSAGMTLTIAPTEQGCAT
jgi:hypothetical protein